jgi:superfamily II DNA/RNA helicase
LSDKTDHPPLPQAFAKLGVRNSVLRGLADAKFSKPSEIQALLIPRALAGVDILGQARTGTGKTAAFTIPVLQKVVRGLHTQALILVPTRELAVQVDSEIKRLAKYTPVRVVPVYGGQKISAQMKFLKNEPEIIVGTPGRVIDLLDRRILDLTNIRFVILDEVDRMLDIGFRDDIRNILSRVKGMSRRLPADAREGDPDYGHGGIGSDRPRRGGGGGRRGDDRRGGRSRGYDRDSDIPPIDRDAPRQQQDVDVEAGHQTIFVSATFSDEIERLARKYMREPVEKLIAPGADDKPTVEKVEQYFFAVEPWDKYRLLRKLLDRENPDLAIVFCRTKHGAEKLAKRLQGDGIECREIHGNLNQNKRDRVMKSFRGGKFDVLVATDLASRGIDVADISHIINFDLPDDPEVYVHRVGRTARMGAEGKAFTFVSRGQGAELTKVEALINMVIPQGELEGWKPSPQPADWKEGKPGVERQQPGTPVPAHPTVPVAPPRRLGSKLPLSRRHKRLR